MAATGTQDNAERPEEAEALTYSQYNRLCVSVARVRLAQGNLAQPPATAQFVKCPEIGSWPRAKYLAGPAASTLSRLYGHWLAAVRAACRFWFDGGPQRVAGSHHHRSAPSAATSRPRSSPPC